MKSLYLECTSGISGDMTVGALLDLGADRDKLTEALRSLPVGGFDVKISRVAKAGIDACDFDVILDKDIDNHDHDMEYLYGFKHEGEGIEHIHEDKKDILDREHRSVSVDEEIEREYDEHYYPHFKGNGEEHGHHGEHTHGEEHGHHGEHTHGEEHAHRGEHANHVHRTLADVMNIVNAAKLTPGALEIATRIFEILAEAEAKAHGTTKDKVHFHEVGAVDSIVDIVAVAVCIDNLGIEDVIVPSVSEGFGSIRCAHGILPVPVPAVANIVAEHGIRMHRVEMEAELVTPTGAAVVAALKKSDMLPKEYRIEKIGYGAGKREYERPSLLRAMIIDYGKCDDKDASSEAINDERYICKVESDIDDCTGEELGRVMEMLMKAGARDVHYIPVYMKKNRPAYELTVICMPEDIEKLENIVFKETTTIGIRRTMMERTVLPRQIKEVEYEGMKVHIKECRLSDGTVKLYPEYEDVKELAEKTGESFRELYYKLAR